MKLFFCFKNRVFVLVSSFGVSLLAGSFASAQEGVGVSAVVAQPAPEPPLMLVGLLFLVLLVVNILIVFLYNSKNFSRKELKENTMPIMKAHGWFLVGVTILQELLVNIPSIVTGTLQASVGLPENEPVSTLLNIAVSLVLGTFLSAGLVRIYLNIAETGSARLADLFSQGSVTLRYLGGSILYSIMVFGGMLLFIVPGVIWSLKYAFWSFYIVDKRVGVMEALHLSSQATYGHKRQLLWLYAFVFALNILGACIFLIGLLVTMPATFLILTYVYRKLDAQRPSQASAVMNPVSTAV